MPTPTSTRILTGTYSAGYTLSASYTNLSIKASAAVTGTLGADGTVGVSGTVGGYGAQGGVGLTVDVYATTHNAGLLTGGGGGAGGAGGATGDGGNGGQGGLGAYQASGLFVNTATIVGGVGGAGGQSVAGLGGHGGQGGVGLELAGAYGVNRGLISGGVGGVYGLGATGDRGDGAGGVGVHLSNGSTLRNLGTITGGAGGGNTITGYGSPGVGVESLQSIVINGSASNRTATIEGNGGVVEYVGAVLNYGTLQGQIFGAAALYGAIYNQGSITGGLFGAASAQGGILVNGSKSNHAASITGGIAGFYDIIGGGRGETVVNYGAIGSQSTGPSIFFSNPYDRLVVEAGSALVGVALGAGGTLELAAGKGQVSGFGSQYQSFGAYQVDAGGAWTVSGVNTMGAGLTVAQYGRLQLGGGPPPARTIPPVTSLTIDGAVSNDGVLSAGGGTLTVDGSVTGAGVVLINGGTAEFDSSFSQNVRFGANGGELILTDSQHFTNRVFGFSTVAQTAFDLRDIAYNTPTFKLHARGGVLTVSDGTHTAIIHVTGKFAGVNWNAFDDGSGGVLVTATPPPAPTASAFSAAMASVGGGSQASASLAPAHSRLSPALSLATPGH